MAEAAPETVPCPDCGAACHPKGVGTHRRHRHGYRTGGQRPPRPRVDTGPLRCPECGEAKQTERGLGAHRFMVHGVLGTSKAAIAVRGRTGHFEPAAPCQAFGPVPIPGGWVVECACGQVLMGARAYELRDLLTAHVLEFLASGRVSVLRSPESAAPA